MNGAARQLGVSRDRLKNIEDGSSRLAIVDIVGICRIYGTSQAEEQELIALAEATTKYRWVEQYGQGIPQYAQKFVSMEQRATRMLIYEAEFVTGLFQTPEYLRASHARDHRYNAKSSEEIIAARLARQRALAKSDNPPQISVIFSEGVLRRMTSTPEIMTDQVERLRKANRLAYVDIAILPFDAGVHPSMSGPYIVLDFADDEPSVVYIESRDGCRYETGPDTVALYRQDFSETLPLTAPLEEIKYGTVA